MQTQQIGSSPTHKTFKDPVKVLPMYHAMLLIHMQVLTAMARHMTSESSHTSEEASNFRQDLDILLLASGPNGAGIGLPLLPEEKFFPMWRWLNQVTET